MINKRSRILSILFLLCAGFSPLWAKDAINYEEILSIYQQGVKSSHDFKGTLYFETQQIYVDSIKEGFPKIIENTYFFPVEDPLYQNVNPLFFKSFSVTNQKAVINGKKQTITRKISNAYTDLFASSPLVPSTSNEMLKHFKTTDPLETQFSLSLNKNSEAKSEPDIFCPPDLSTWHYMPNLWFPGTDQLGFPKDITLVNCKNSNQVIVYLYTPEKIDESLMNYLRKNTMKADLSHNDLEIILTIETKTNYCKSLLIVAKFDQKRRTLFNIVNSGSTPTYAGFTMPSLTLVNSLAAKKEEDGTITWGTNYYGQFSLSSFERDK